MYFGQRNNYKHLLLLPLASRLVFKTYLAVTPLRCSGRSTMLHVQVSSSESDFSV